MKPKNLLLVMMAFIPSLLCAQTKGEMSFTSSSPEAKKLLRQAWNDFADHKLEDGNVFVKQALEKDPNFALAYASLFTSNVEERKENLRKAESLKVSADEKSFLQGMYASLEQKSTGVYYDPLVKKYPNDKSLQLWIILTYGDVNKKIEIGEKLIKQSPDFAAGYNALGYSYMEANKMDKAEACFNKYVNLRPDLANVYDSKADYLMRTGKIEEAIALYEKAASMDPRNMSISSTKAIRAKVQLEGFTVPERTPVQKHNRTIFQTWAIATAGISVAKKSGMSVHDFATQMGDLFKTSWNKDNGFEGFVQGTLFNFEHFRRESDPPLEIMRQDKNGIQFKWKTNYSMWFEDGYLFSVTYEELNQWLAGIHSRIAEYMGSTFEQEAEGDYLKITIGRKTAM
jgi:tetratricopeptide (TPR) repeat protein